MKKTKKLHIRGLVVILLLISMVMMVMAISKLVPYSKLIPYLLDTSSNMVIKFEDLDTQQEFGGVPPHIHSWYEDVESTKQQSEKSGKFKVYNHNNVTH